MASPFHLQHKSFQGKVVMVTGASAGLGRQICQDLGRAGCRIIAAARRIDRLTALCEEIHRMADDGVTRAVAVDISADPKHMEAAVNRACAAFGTIDVLVNNAEFRGGLSSPIDLSEEEWEKAVKTNLTGTWLVSKFVCRLIRSAEKGSVINISSIVGLTRGQFPGVTAYAATKAGIISLRRWLWSWGIIIFESIV